MNPFKNQTTSPMEPKRNAFDTSFQNNLTLKMGKLTPCYLQEVVPGSSVKIDPTLAFKFMPMVFPIQTRLRAHMSFFYVRNRTLWKDWKDFVGDNKEGLVFPYIKQLASTSQGRKFFSTGSLSDYLGVPTTLPDDYAQFKRLELVPTYVTESRPLEPSSLDASGYSLKPDDHSGRSVQTLHGETPLTIYDRQSSMFCLFHDKEELDLELAKAYALRSPTREIISPALFTSQDLYSFYGLTPSFNKVDFELPSSGDMYFSGSQHNLATDETEDIYLLFFAPRTEKGGSDVLVGYVQTPVLESNGALKIELSSISAAWNAALAESSNGFMRVGFFSNSYDASTHKADSAIFSFPDVLATDPSYMTIGTCLETNIDQTFIVDAASDVNNDICPFLDYGDGAGPAIPLSSLPFRAYEAVYNAFFRDVENEPFMPDGVNIEYNKFITTDQGGADDTPYHLFDVNWEMDPYTSALAEPQAGELPLVGVSQNGLFKFRDDETGAHYEMQCTIGEDGHTLTGISVASEEMPRGQVRAMRDLINSGISINDFRNVNSLQRWFETKIRRRRYREQMKGFFGVDLKYNELEMPEFLGGFNEDVNIEILQQQVANEVAPLGNYGGNAYVAGSSKHSITNYCDEHGFIIGLVWITPTPMYSQMLPKLFTKQQTLDFWFPHFNNIGYQPLTYREVCPVSVRSYDLHTGQSHLDNVFGYQLPFYDLKAHQDEVHGAFRTSLRDYLINRTFKGLPVRGADMLHINQDDLNDVFAVQDDSDKIVGQCLFKVVTKHPLPMFFNPRLE